MHPETNELAVRPVPTAPVSFDHESLILVDEDDRVVGHAPKQDIHQDGRLHRAFSIFLFAGSERVLLHKRSASKPLWPGYWTNSCCSHPRRGESCEGAAHRRLKEELGVSADLAWLYRFQYRAQYRDRGYEHELCSVLVGNVSEALEVAPHPEEVMAWDWFDCDEVDRLIVQSGEDFTPWFKLEWARLRGDFRNTLEQLCDGSTDLAVGT